MTGCSTSADLMRRFAQIPADFPRRTVVQRGLQPLFSTVAFNRTYYRPGCAPREVVERWEDFEELALQLAKSTSNHKLVKTAPNSKAAVLAALFERVLAVEDCAEIRWAGRRAAQLLKCEVPQAAKLMTAKELPAPMSSWTLQPPGRSSGPVRKQSAP